MKPASIPFSLPFEAGDEVMRLRHALRSGFWQGDGPATAEATALLESIVPGPKAMLTTSCTHALEMASLLLDLGEGDEVIVPSFTFPSTAAAIAIRGATPVFVDVESISLNLDPRCVAKAISERTRAIFVVHYAGVAADVEALLALCRERDLILVEDNAHGLGARWLGRQLGTFGALATQSFHATKNVSCGEGGALLLNDEGMVERAEIIREKGTNRLRFLRGEVDKYTWVDVGSSYLPSDVLAALLVGQLERFDDIQARRMAIWDAYQEGTRSWAIANGVDIMEVPTGAEHPAHMFYMLMPGPADQAGLISHLRDLGITATFHYQPLHSSPAGRRIGRTPDDCPVTVDAAQRLVRLPLYAGMNSSEVDRVLDGVTTFRARRTGRQA